jgi:hypothetical protein
MLFKKDYIDSNDEVFCNNEAKKKQLTRPL